MKKFKSKKLDFMGMGTFNHKKVSLWKESDRGMNPYTFDGGYWYNRFLMADKRAKKCRKEVKNWKTYYWDMFNKSEKRMEGLSSQIKVLATGLYKASKQREVTDLKRKKAWTAFYIVTVLYVLCIVGIIILI